MNRTRRAARLMLALILAVMVISTGFYTAGYAAEGESSVDYVKRVAKAINQRTDTPDMFYSGTALQFDLNTPPKSRTFYALLDFKAEAEEGYPQLVRYSCKVPGVVAASYCTAYDVCFNSLQKYSEWVEVSGILKVLDLGDGKHKIDISDCDNAFSAYAGFKYINPIYFTARGIDVSQGYASANRGEVVAVLAGLASETYAKMTGVESAEKYVQTVVLPELKNAVDNQEKWAKNRNETGFMRTGLVLKIVAGIAALPLLYLIYRLLTFRSRRVKLALDSRKSGSDRFDAIKKLDYDKYRDRIADIALNDKNSSMRQAALQMLKYPEDRETIRKVASGDEMSFIRKDAIKKLSYPEDKDLFTDLILNSRLGEFDALRRLQYPEDRDTFIAAVRTNKNSNLRYEAMDYLKTPSVPEEGKALEYVARNDGYQRCRYKALGLLSYPEHRNTIREIALHDEDPEMVSCAVGMLSPDRDSDLIRKFALDSRDDIRLEGIIKLKYEKDREILVKAAEKDPDTEIRCRALEKLSPDKDHEVISRIYETDESFRVRDLAFSMLSYDKAHDVIANAALKDKDASNRRTAIEKLKYPQDKATLAAAAQYDEDPANRTLAAEKLPFLDNHGAVVKEGLDLGKYDTLSDNNIRVCERAAIALAFEPENTKRIKQFLCKNIQRGLNEGDKGRHTTLAGWSAAALGRVLALSFKPSQIESNYKKLQPAFDRYNEYIGQAQALYTEFNECRDDFAGYKKRRTELLGDGGAYFAGTTRDSRLRELSRQIDSVHAELAPGPGNYMIDNGDEPMAYLVHLLRDNQSRIPRFVKQGVIMGLVDWLAANRSVPQAEELLKTVLEVRKQMITTDDKLSFFEVRVPLRCTRIDYERILADVLHCANPSVKYADMTELMEVAEKEVPGCMDMLTACPLRIIDPANQADLGFYQFEPFIHRMWYLYEPPQGTGPVKARYHEVDDRTRPLSSGLHLRLFTDPYSVIPTLFHEHEHFAGDPNEASVFLKTQMFSIDFYKRYSGAKPAKDVVFATLTDLLGMPPQENKRGDLNELIKKYYGEQTSQEEAEKRANGQISMMNLNINLHNKNERWCPDIKYPLFSEEEDNKNMTIIHDSIVKFCTAPKSVTEQEYRAIVGKA